MNYEGKLYGKIGRKTIPLSNTTKDWDIMAAENKRLRLANDAKKAPQAMQYEPVLCGDSEQFVNFLFHLNEKGLINNHDFDYEKEAKKYIKKIN